MEYFYLNNFADFNYTYEYYFYDLVNYTMFEEFDFRNMNNWQIVGPSASHMISCIVISIGFPLTLFAIYALYSLVRHDHVAPVYVINLLISDLIQMCCMVIWVADHRSSMVFYFSTLIYYIGVMASVGFMVCVALERYLVVACPLWYRFRRNVKLSVQVSIMVWVLCFIEFLVARLTNVFVIVRFIFLLLPFPLLIIFSAGTFKALSAAISVTPKEKRRILGTLVLVLLKYTLLFLPLVIWLLEMSCRCLPYIADDSRLYLSFLQFSPLADLVLYVFMRKGAADKLLDSLCCCRMTGEEEVSQIDAEEVCSV
ncbi:G-protein coupled receptor 4-like [Seriola dumerili]|uniref:G-protein coupled receptor 4-like n=1 Tax=Seriola dumerili TaxID=41447 RepID=UPI000BBE5711|nr:G-protein coupled receptor 4-like [Seriola dumerili]